MNNEVVQGNMVASVGNRILYKSELDNVIHPNTSRQDSIALASAYIDQWVRDQLMAREAARFFSTDFEIERLVDDYREKLLRFNLEEEILSTRFDTTISENEIITFYEKMKEQFFLSENLYRCRYMKFDKKTTGLKTFVKDWKEDNNDGAITDFGRAFANEHHLDTTRWITLTQLNNWHDGWSMSRAEKHLNQRQSNEKYEFFLKIVDHKDKGDISPLEYIKPQLSKMLLHRRKQTIIEDYKQELYESALSTNNIKLP